jgi:hypothetical protein
MANFVDDTESQVYSTKNFLMFEVRQPYAHKNLAIKCWPEKRSPAHNFGFCISYAD